jgi:hypothetical protein
MNLGISGIGTSVNAEFKYIHSILFLAWSLLITENMYLSSGLVYTDRRCANGPVCGSRN